MRQPRQLEMINKAFNNHSALASRRRASEAGSILSSSLYSLLIYLLNASTEEGESPKGAITTPFSTMEEGDWINAVNLWNQFGKHVINSLPARGCPACGIANQSREIFKSYDGYEFHECENCFCWFVPRRVEAEIFDKFFDEFDKAKKIANRSFKKRQSEENLSLDLERFRFYFNLIKPLLPKRKGLHYLDVGCGLGNSIVFASDLGMLACGIETSKESIRIAKKRKIPIFNYYDELPFKKFDLISFWESLEHISDPVGALNSCKSLLHENGLVIFSIPNLNSPLLRLQRADSTIIHGGYDTPGHINLFGEEQIKVLFDRAGYEILHLDGQYSDSLPELVSYMLGKHMGAKSLLDGGKTEHGLTQDCSLILENIAEVVSLLQRETLTAPILFGVACIKGRKEHFKERISILDRSRSAQIVQRMAEHAPIDIAPLIEGNSNDLSKAFTSFFGSRKDVEVTRLESSLAERTAAVDLTLAEVTKRDDLLTKIQQEVNKRDAMLVEQGGEIARLQEALSLETDLRSQLADEKTILESSLAERTAAVDLTLAELTKRELAISQKDIELDQLKREIQEREANIITIRNELFVSLEEIVNQRARFEFYQDQTLWPVFNIVCKFEDSIRQIFKK